MRVKQKEEALQFIDVLLKTVDQIRLCLSQKDLTAVVNLLQDCQSGAITLGTMIEESEGEGFVTVGLLEGYCEKLYQLHEKILSLQMDEIPGLFREITDLLESVKQSVKKDIVVKKTVVFLPYKASMWDSLESVWRQLSKEENCTTYVIPIPYYDKNSDGTMKEEHYEGMEFPKDVPITPYQEFDFEGVHPDEIYIHNPYDYDNFVTSVHPYFYSANLKTFTDKLIYIPYFVLEEINPNNQMALDSIAHLVSKPGVINADLVILQSEAIRQAYINILTKYGGEESRPVWESRIVGTGSPKLEKVKETKKEDQEIPKEWLQLIQKEDGTWKKIVLYNTSVTAFLENDEQMVKKIKSVLQIFFEKREDVTLLWRPHPLMKATIESMRPDLWESYYAVVEEYKNAGWGIYDDTAELDRAIAISDAYYGDSSSLVKLCKTRKMPIMIQNASILE